jgi:outer membrane protein OmpA-like peptidoglycan-associated protein
MLGTLALASAALRADPGDVDSSHDYPGFPRLPGFVITDYDEDSPAGFDFPVARPLPIDANHIETVHVRGHRYVIRYEFSDSQAPGLFETQRYYEKLASAAGFTIEKNGAVGDVTETFYRAAAGHKTWIYLEPAVIVNVLTIVESTGTISPPPLPLAAATTAPIPTAPAPIPVASAPILVAPAPVPAPPAPPVDPNGDSIYNDLNANGRVVLPFVFQPGKDALDASSQPLIDRVAAMMNRHPDLVLRIEGHTDNVGDPDDNMRLSAERALAVQALLVAARIDPKRLDAVGVGGLQPLADDDTAEGRQKNRRIELVVWKKYPAFHASAPNGQNYYPDTGSSPVSERAGL